MIGRTFNVMILCDVTSRVDKRADDLPPIRMLVDPVEESKQPLS